MAINSSRGKGGQPERAVLRASIPSWIWDKRPHSPLFPPGGTPPVWGAQSRTTAGFLIEESQPFAPLPPQKCSRGSVTCISSTTDPSEHLSHLLPGRVGSVTPPRLFYCRSNLLGGKTSCSSRANNPFLRASQALNPGTDLSHTLLNHPG